MQSRGDPVWPPECLHIRQSSVIFKGGKKKLLSIQLLFVNPLSLASLDSSPKGGATSLSSVKQD